MAAPTEVRVESNSIDTATLRWSYGGTLTVEVYRSTDGTSYVVVAGVPPGTTTYTDTGLNAATLYYYKLSDDGGATFSSVVTVVTQSCGNIAGQASAVQLPRAGSEVTSDQFNDAMVQLETANSSQVTAKDPCDVCVNNGAVVYDCTNGCTDFITNVNGDINSVTIQNCEQPGTITLQFPPNTTRRVCGWPAGMGFGGDECTQAPVVSGAAGRQIPLGYSGNTNRAKAAESQKGYGTGAGGARGGATCACVPGQNGELTIKSCNNNNSLDCSGSRSLTLKVCGGQGPYSWSHTGNVGFKKSSGGTSNTATGNTVAVVPPSSSSSGSQVAGTAYTQVKSFCYCGNSSPACGPSCGPLNAVVWTDYGCNDQFITNGCSDDIGNPTGCGVGFAGTCVDGDCTDCINVPCTCSGGPCSGSKNSYHSQAFGCASNEPVTGGTACDKRTPSMIAAGCAPCGQSAGSTVSVTDNLGVTVTIVLRA